MERVLKNRKNEMAKYLCFSIKEFPLSVTQAGNHTVGLMVEPLTRVNFRWAGDFDQQNGIASIHQSKIDINCQKVTNIEVIAAELTNTWVSELMEIREVENAMNFRAPVMIQSSFNISGEPADGLICGIGTSFN